MTPLTFAHAKLLASMHKVCFAKPWDEKAMADLLSMPGCFGFIADRSGPQGFVLARVAADEAEILTLLVLPPYRRQGLARDLLDLAAAQALSRGAVKLFLEVAANNVAAHSLYIASGFTQVAIRPRYYESGVDALLLTKEL